jgi:hypothetical protein
MHDIESTGLPVRAALQPTGLYLELRDVGPEQLQDPFLQETIQRVPARQAVIQIAKADLGRAAPDTAPAGLIFHVARCGSTLASQILKHHDGIVVYSEPLSVNEILVPPHKWDRSELVGALRSLGGVFARHARKPYVLKLSSWNTLFCDIVAEAFPSTPWALCIRDPIEVCVSLLQQRPGWLRDAGSSSQLFADVVDPGRAARTPEDYVARLYASFCRAATKLETERGKLVFYGALPEAVWSKMGPHFGLSISRQLEQRMAAAARTYSKSPVGRAAEFVPDDVRKRAAASPELLRAVDAVARPALEHLTARFREG